MRFSSSYVWAALIATIAIIWMFSDNLINIFVGDQEAEIKDFTEDTTSKNFEGNSLVVSAIEVKNESVPIYFRSTGITKSIFDIQITARREGLIENIYAVDDLFSIPTNAIDISIFLSNFIKNNNLLHLNNIYHLVNNGDYVSWFEFSKKILKIYSNYNNTKSKILPISAKDLFKNNIRPTFSALDNKKIIKTSKLKIANWENTLNETIKRIIL